MIRLFLRFLGYLEYDGDELESTVKDCRPDGRYILVRVK